MSCLHIPRLLVILFFFSDYNVFGGRESQPTISNKSFFDLNLKSSLKEDSRSEFLLRNKRASVAGSVAAIQDRYDEARVVPHSRKEKVAILAKHREFRSRTNPRAADMEYMYWNEELAYLAGLWASVCYWGHGLPEHTLMNNFESVGQNLWLGRGKPDGSAAVVAWHNNEERYYDFDDNKCVDGKMCGHYTQVLWSKSKEVGCSRAFCRHTIDQDGKKTDRTNIWIEACHYAPAGNYIGVKPFKRGLRCRQCRSGIGQCYNNMCRLCSNHDELCDCQQVCRNGGTVTSDCMCSCPNGWYGPDCSAKCKNKHKRCGKSPGWPGPSSCNKHKAIPRKCPLMCGICNEASEELQPTHASKTEAATRKYEQAKTTAGQKTPETPTTEVPTRKSVQGQDPQNETSTSNKTNYTPIAEIPTTKPSQSQNETNTTEYAIVEVLTTKPGQSHNETTEVTTANAKPSTSKPMQGQNETKITEATTAVPKSTFVLDLTTEVRTATLVTTSKPGTTDAKDSVKENNVGSTSEVPASNPELETTEASTAKIVARKPKAKPEWLVKEDV